MVADAPGEPREPGLLPVHEDSFTAHALVKLLDTYQKLLVNLARDCYEKELWEAGGTFLLARTLENKSLRAAIVASVVGGSELSSDFVRESKKVRGQRGPLKLPTWGLWEDSSDPLGSLKNFGRFPGPGVEVDSKDGWY